MARHRDKGHGLPVSQGDGAGFVQQQHIDVARGFNSPAGHGDDISLEQAVHAGNADGGQQGGDGGGNQADKQGDDYGERYWLPLAPGLGAVNGNRAQI
jgi:hypothetical protein